VSATDEEDWREYRVPAVSPLLQTSLDCFVTNGYHGTTTRMLASAAGLSVPGLYHHYESKQALLVELMQLAMIDLWRRSQAADREAGVSIETRFQFQIECLVLFHAHRQDLAFLAANEIRSLEPVARAAHIASRDRQQRLLDDITLSGVELGTFQSETPHETSRAMVSMCTGVAQWFKANGPLSPEELAGIYITLASRALGRSN
jgi:AcrR family transcriptional regulator